MERFDYIVATADDDRQAASRAILNRLPWVFDSKDEYLHWRESLARDMKVDGQDILLVGSAATGRSLNPRKRFRQFNSSSDLDIAVVSRLHFDISWQWLLDTNPALISGMTEEALKKFRAHEAHYIYEGVIAAEDLLGFLPFAAQWNDALQRNEKLLPMRARGRRMFVRIYKDARSLRDAQEKSILNYRRSLSGK